jgi:hypothetical protein
MGFDKGKATPEGRLKSYLRTEGMRKSLPSNVFEILTGVNGPKYWSPQARYNGKEGSPQAIALPRFSK